MNIAEFLKRLRSSKFTIHDSPFIIAVAALFTAMAGCVSFEQTFANSFMDDDGNTVHVVSGRLSDDHVFKVVSPGNGQLVDYKSREAVKITLPDGRNFTAYQTLNTIPIGNMYMTDDEGIVYVTNGLMCRIYALLEDGSDHLLVFEGNLTKNMEDAN